MTFSSVLTCVELNQVEPPRSHCGLKLKERVHKASEQVNTWLQRVALVKSNGKTRPNS